MTILSAINFDFSRVDGNAVTIFIIGFSVVFSALIIIYLIFSVVPYLMKINIKKKSKPEVKAAEPVIITDGEVYAAIGMALILHSEDQHDDESMILTLNINDRLNSPWNSKLQNLNLHNK